MHLNIMWTVFMDGVSRALALVHLISLQPTYIMHVHTFSVWYCSVRVRLMVV